MRTRRSNNTTGNKGKKKERHSTSSPDIVDSPINGTTTQKGRVSPGTVSTCSSSSTDKDSKRKTTTKDRQSSGRKRLNNSEIEDDKNSKKKKSQERSDSDSLSESSSNEEEEIEGEAELEEVNQDDLSSSSPPSTPSPIDNDKFELQKDCIKPEPQHPVQSPSHHPLLYPPVVENHINLPQQPSLPLVAHSVPLPSVSHVEGAHSPVPFIQETTPKIDLHPATSTPSSTLPPLHPSAAPPPASQPLPSTHPPSNHPASTHSQPPSTHPPPPPSTHQPLPPPSTQPSAAAAISQPLSFQPTFNPPPGLTTQSHPPPLIPSHTPPNPTPPVPGLIPIKKEPQSPPRAQTWEETIIKTVESADLTNQQPDIKPPPFSMSIEARIDPDRGRIQIKEERDVPPSFLPSVPAPMRTSTPNPVPSSLPVHPTQPTIEGPGLIPSVIQEPHISHPEPRNEPEVVQIDTNDEASDDERDGTLTPGPDPTPCSKEVHRSKAAIFIQILNRGANNSCARCDLVFRPSPNSPLAKKREDRERKSSQSTSQPPRDEKPPMKRTETPPRSHSVDAHLPGAHSHSTPSFVERHTPRSLYTDTPALRQLSEYARPHALGSESVPRSVPYSVGSMTLPQQVDPMMSYRLAMYPPGSRERLELELERDKRERDARERDLREREIRDMEFREKMKEEMAMKPPGTPGSKLGLDRLVQPGANPLDPHWLELQRRYGYPPGAALVPANAGSASTSGAHMPGVYPPASLANDLLAREREKLDRLGLPPHALGAFNHRDQAILQSEIERVSASERLHAERMMLASADPVLRMQMGLAAANNAAMHAHTHTHAHSHTHLHLHPDNPPGAGSTPSSSLHPLISPHLYPPIAPGVDPMSGVPGSSPAAAAAAAGIGGQNHAALSALPPGMPSSHGVIPGSREHELLQRELLSRAYLDPALAHQLNAQAAHHDAIQRQLALERDRYGNAGHLPH